MAELYQQHCVLAYEDMNKGVDPDPEPVSIAGGSGVGPPCSYLQPHQIHAQSKEAAEGGGRARPSPLPSASDYPKSWANLCEISNDGKTRLKNTQYLTVNIANGREINLRDLRQKFPYVKIQRLPDYPVLGEELSIYEIDRQLTFYNFKVGVK